MKKYFLAGLASLLLAQPVLAETVSGLTAQPGGTYILQIDGKRYIALSQADANSAIDALAANAALQQKVDELSAQLARYQSLTQQYEELRQNYLNLTGNYKTLSEDALQLNSQYASAANNLLTLNSQYSTLAHDYDSLANQYRTLALRSHPRGLLDVGVGVINAEEKTRPVVLLGAGTTLLDYNLRAWLFGGPNTYGVVVGGAF